MHSGRSILVTGSNRGLGLEWVRQYAGLGWQIFASCRFPKQADELHALAREFSNIFIHQLDVSREEEILQLATQLEGESIDLLINNAGVYYERWGKDRLGAIDYGNWNETLAVNTLGPMRVSEAFVDNIARSETRLIVTITSHMGSITDISTANDYAYRSSKSALNAAMKGLSLEVADRNIGVMLLHPGWVRTRMGGESAPLSCQESVSAMRRLVERFNPGQSGRFFRYDGSEIPW